MQLRIALLLLAAALLTGCCATRTLGVYVVDADSLAPLPGSKVTVAAYPSPIAESATRCKKTIKTNRNGWAYADWPVDYEKGQLLVRRVGYRTQRMDDPPFPTVTFYLEPIRTSPLPGDSDFP